MSVEVEGTKSNRTGFKVEGDLGDLQILEEEMSQSEDDANDAIEDPHKVRTLAIPENLIQAKSTPVFGNVAVTNSENVHFGNNTYFNGPVTIRQIIHTGPGSENPSYQKTDDENIPNGNSTHFKNDSMSEKLKSRTCYKLSCSAVVIVLISSICIAVVITIHQNRVPDNYGHAAGAENYTNYELVMGLFYESIQVILLSVILVPIPSLLLYIYSFLLTHCQVVESPISSTQTHRIDNNLKADDILITPGHLRIVSRTDWLAQPVEEPIEKIKQPVPWVIITHTATEGCFTQSECVLRVRLIQTFHIESKGWSDVGYNFMVGGDGSAYYGRGWDQVGAHTKGYNRYSIGIAFIGTFNTEIPSKHQVQACKELLKFGVEKGYLAKDYKLFAHRQLMSTLSPGDKVYDIIKTWPHFVKINTTDVNSLIPK